jgi:hypothetical protein
VSLTYRLYTLEGRFNLGIYCFHDVILRIKYSKLCWYGINNNTNKKNKIGTMNLKGVVLVGCVALDLKVRGPFLTSPLAPRGEFHP